MTAISSATAPMPQTAPVSQPKAPPPRVDRYHDGDGQSGKGVTVAAKPSRALDIQA